MANWGVLIIILAHPLLILVHFRKIVNLRLGTMFWSLKLWYVQFISKWKLDCGHMLHSGD